MRMKTMPLYAGLDMHSATTTGTIKDEKGNPIRVLKVETSKEGMKKLFDRLDKNQISAVFEASHSWPYYARLLEPHCKNITMAHPLRVRAIASARIKTDTIDSTVLSDLLRGDLIPQSYMPSLEFVELRELVRYRAYLSSMRGKYKARIRLITKREGKSCEWTDVTAKRARLWLNNLELSKLNSREVDHMIKLIDMMDKEITELDKTIDKEQYRYPEVDILKSIPGINTYSALLLIGEIVDIGRFPTADNLASYAGIVPSTYQSSTTCYNGRITKQGSKWLRWILTQCTHASLKTRKTHRLKSFYLRIARKKGKQKAIVATARKMITIIWHLLHKNEYYAM